MFKAIYNKLFKKTQKNSTPNPFSSDDFKRALESQIANLAAQEEARGNPAPYAFVKPIIPIDNSQDSKSWFGGHPTLPPHLPWPKIEEQDALFLCQIDCSSLPKDLWGGLGPRTGWLRFFAAGNWPPNPIVVYSKEFGEFRKGPKQKNDYWFQPSSRGFEPVGYLPQWPVELIRHVGPQPAPRGFRAGSAPSFPNPQKDIPFGMQRDVSRPFDLHTLRLFLEIVRENLVRQHTHAKNLTAHYEDGGATSPNNSFIDELVSETEQQVRELEALADNLSELARLDKVETDTFIQDCEKVGDLKFIKFEVRNKDDVKEGEPRFNKHTNPMRENSILYHDYKRALYDHVKHLYSRQSDVLPAEVTTWFEGEASFETLHQHGAMGHSPLGHIYTPYGPSSENEILLELDTSQLSGWIWGDCYSLVLIIQRDDLAKNDFNNVTFDITN